jgi:hypothetical protein
MDADGPPLFFLRTPLEAPPPRHPVGLPGGFPPPIHQRHLRNSSPAWGSRRWT